MSQYSVSASSGSGETVIVGTTTTVGAVTAAVITLPLGSIAGVYTMDVKIVGFDSSTPLGAGYTIVGSVRTNGTTATLIPDQVTDAFEEGALSAGNAALAVSANNALINVTGTAGKTIKWKAVLEYVLQT